MRKKSASVLRRCTGPAISAAFVWLAACNSVPSDPIVGEPTIVGHITRADTNQNGFRVLVEENAEVNGPLSPGGSKIWFTVAERTAIFDARGPSITRASAESLRVGLRVEALADGSILESYPAQAGAETIVILD